MDIFNRIGLNRYIRNEYIKYGWKLNHKDIFEIWLGLPLKEKVIRIFKQFRKGF